MARDLCKLVCLRSNNNDYNDTGLPYVLFVCQGHEQQPIIGVSAITWPEKMESANKRTVAGWRNAQFSDTQIKNSTQREGQTVKIAFEATRNYMKTQSEEFRHRIDMKLKLKDVDYEMAHKLMLGLLSGHPRFLPGTFLGFNHEGEAGRAFRGCGKTCSKRWHAVGSVVSCTFTKSTPAVLPLLQSTHDKQTSTPIPLLDA